MAFYKWYNPRNYKRYTLPALYALIASVALIWWISSSKDMSCVFCNILNGENNTTKIEIETTQFVIFKDIKPASTYHYLAVSKRHIESIKALTKEDDDLVANMEIGLKEIFRIQGIDTTDVLFGFHLPPFISVRHLHMHAIAPRSTMGFFNRAMFKPGSYWFKTVEEVRQMLREK